MQKRITQALIGTLKPGAYDLADAEQRGLVLRVRPSGVYSWIVRLGSRWFTIGRADVIPPAKARETARKVIGRHEAGDDPLGAKKRARQQVKQARIDALTLADFLARQYTPWAKQHHKTGATNAARLATAFPDFLPVPLTKITAFDIERWRAARHRDGLTRSTTNRNLDDLRAVLTKAVEWSVLRDHPMRTVKRARLDTIGRVRFLSPAEDVQLRNALTEREKSLRAGRASFNAWRAARGYKLLPDYQTYADHLQPIVLVALQTGARRGELFDLRWESVDLTRGEITFTGATTKSGKTRRIPMTAEARTLLQAWRDQQPEKRRASEALVFPSPQTGERLDNITTAWSGLVKLADLKNFTFHCLRHTFASNLAQRGVDLFTIQQLLGHASPVMTQRYSHLAGEHLAAAIAKLG